MQSDKASAVAAEEWVAVEDATSGRTYYANMRTRETRWDKPAGFKEVQAPLQYEAQSDSDDTSLPADSKWRVAHDPATGHHYYYHSETSETRWKKPKPEKEGHSTAAAEAKESTVELETTTFEVSADELKQSEEEPIEAVAVAGVATSEAVVDEMHLEQQRITEMMQRFHMTYGQWPVGFQPHEGYTLSPDSTTKVEPSHSSVSAGFVATAEVVSEEKKEDCDEVDDGDLKQFKDWFQAAFKARFHPYLGLLFENGVDSMETMALMTAEDLKGFGIPFGHSTLIVHKCTLWQEPGHDLEQLCDGRTETIESAVTSEGVIGSSEGAEDWDSSDGLDVWQPKLH